MPVTSLVAKRPIRRGDKGADVRAVQIALRAAGHELVVDGDFGRITETAVRQFQASNKLTIDGVVGPITAAALDRVFESAIHAPDNNLHEFPRPSVLAVAPWLSVMRAITGTKEVPGEANSPIILSWVGAIIRRYPDLADGIGWYKRDSDPWCGLSGAYAVAEADHKPPLNPLWVRNWVNDSGFRKLNDFAQGAIVILPRGDGGHLTIYEGDNGSVWYGRGGNQSDMVNVAQFPFSRKPLAILWPKNAPPPLGGRVRTTFANAVASAES